MSAALGTGQARQPLPDAVFFTGRWWMPASAGWIQIDNPAAAESLTSTPSAPAGLSHGQGHGPEPRT